MNDEIDETDEIINDPIYLSDLTMFNNLYIDLNELFNNILINLDDFRMEETYINNSYDDISFINNTFNDIPTYKKVFDVVSHGYLLEHCLYSSEYHKNIQCPIYMVDFEEGDEVVSLPCKHCFVSEAIHNWLENESYFCPCCRYELPSIEIKNIQT